MFPTWSPVYEGAMEGSFIPEVAIRGNDLVWHVVCGHILSCAEPRRTESGREVAQEATA